MLTYLVRHARTDYSASYLVNGRPEIGVPIDQAGREQCRTALLERPWETIATCVVSRFPRTTQTAELLLPQQAAPIHVNERLGEIDYGVFEGGPFLEYGRWLEGNGPWQRPPGSSESQREAIVRMLGGLRDVLVLPGPRLVVTHGLLVSVIRQGSVAGCFFPEAPYVTPLQFSDGELCELVARLIEQINQERCQSDIPGTEGSISADRAPPSC